MHGNAETKRARPMRKPIVTNASFVIKPVKGLIIRSDFKRQYPVLEHSSSPRAAGGGVSHGKRSDRARRTGEGLFPRQRVTREVGEVFDTRRADNDNQNQIVIRPSQNVALSDALNQITAFGRIVKRNNVNANSDMNNGLIGNLASDYPSAFYAHAPPKPTFFTPLSSYNPSPGHQSQGQRGHVNSRGLYMSGGRSSAFRNQAYEHASLTSRRLLILPVVPNSGHISGQPTQDALLEEDATLLPLSRDSKTHVDTQHPSSKREKQARLGQAANANTDDAASVAESLPAKVPANFLRRQPSAKTWRTWRRVDESDAYSDVAAYIADNELMSPEKNARIARWIADVGSSRADDVTRPRSVKLAPAIKPIAAAVAR